MKFFVVIEVVSIKFYNGVAVVDGRLFRIWF